MSDLNLKLNPSPEAKFKYGMISLCVGGAASIFTYLLVHHVAGETIVGIEELLDHYDLQLKAE